MTSAVTYEANSIGIITKLCLTFQNVTNKLRPYLSHAPFRITLTQPVTGPSSRIHVPLYSVQTYAQTIHYNTPTICTVFQRILFNK